MKCNTWPIRAAVVLLPSLALNAQPQIRPPRAVWDGNKLIQLDPEAGTVAWISEKGRPIQKFPAPRHFTTPYRVVDWFEGAVWLNVGKGETLEVWRSAGPTWELVAHLKPHSSKKPLYVSSIVPLENGRFLALAWGPQFVEQGRYWPLAILSRRGESLDLEVQETLDLGFETPFLPRVGTQGNPLLTSALYDTRFVRCGDRLILPFPQWGLFTILSATTGRLRRNAQALRNVPEKELLTNRRIWVTLGYQPTQEGNLLVARRHEDAVLHGPKLLEKAPEGPLPESSEGQKRHWDSVLKDHAFVNHLVDLVLWYELDPITGKWHEVAPPRGAKTSLKQIGGQVHDFNWRIRPDGGVTFTSGREIMEVHNRRTAERMAAAGEVVPEELQGLVKPEKPVNGKPQGKAEPGRK